MAEADQILAAIERLHVRIDALFVSRSEPGRLAAPHDDDVGMQIHQATSNLLGVCRRLEERIERLEMLSIGRRLSAKFLLRVQGDYPDLDLDLAREAFEEWLAREPPQAAFINNPSTAFRRFLKQWTTRSTEERGAADELT